MPLHPVSWIRGQVASRLLRTAWGRRQFAMVSELAAFFSWHQATFGPGETLPTRTALWKRISSKMRDTGGEWHVIELGVAFGHGAHWWLGHHDASVIETYDGFDRFTGLPRSWRGFSEGTFDAGGQTPDIDDPRVTWHRGNVEETIMSLSDARIASGQRLVLFDLDLYEPSRVAWNRLRPILCEGDIIYLDEAYDADEFRLISHDIVPSGHFDLVGATPLAIAIAVVSDPST